MLPYLIIPAFVPLVLLIPVSADLNYDSDGLRVYLRVWIKLIRLFPKIKQEKSYSGKNKTKRRLSFREWSDIIKILKEVIRKIKLDKFKLHYTSAGDDPFNVVTKYYCACTAVSAIYPFVDAKDKDIKLKTDFDSKKSIIIFNIKITARLFQIILASVAAGASLIKIFFKRKAIHGK